MTAYNYVSKVGMAIGALLICHGFSISTAFFVSFYVFLVISGISAGRFVLKDCLKMYLDYQKIKEKSGMLLSQPRQR